jgi:hypothetical protein
MEKVLRRLGSLPSRDSNIGSLDGLRTLEHHVKFLLVVCSLCVLPNTYVYFSVLPELHSKSV